MPSTISFVVSMERASSTVIVPSLPTFAMHSAMILPISVSPLAEMVATCSIFVLSSFTSSDRLLSFATTVSTALSMPRLMYIGEEPAVTLLSPSLKMDSASTVAVVVPSPATSDVLDATSRTICAPMFWYGSSSSISLATLTPSLVTVGEPHFLSSTTLRPRGPSVTFTALARISTPFMISARACSLNSNILAAMMPPVCGIRRPVTRRRRVRGGSSSLGRLAQHAEDLVLAQDHVLGAVDLHVGAAVLADEHAIALLDLDGDAPALIGEAARAHGHDLALLGLLLGGVRDDDAAPDGLLLLDAADQEPVGERLEVHVALLGDGTARRSRVTSPRRARSTRDGWVWFGTACAAPSGETTAADATVRESIRAGRSGKSAN